MPLDNKSERRLTYLINKQKSLFTRFQLIYDAAVELETHPNVTEKLKAFQIRANRASETHAEFKNVLQEIIEIKQELYPEEQVSFAPLDSLEEMFDFIQYINQNMSNISPKVNTETKPRTIYMPKIQLVKFSGEDITLWPLFYENFKALIHSNADLSNAEKLQYLLGSLEGKALKCCSALEPIPDNYQIIWNLIENNYQNKRYLATTYLEKLLNFRPITSDNPSALQIFLENFDVNVSALKRLQLNDLLDFILTYIALSKLPPHIVKNFELLKNDEELPKYENVINFVRQQSKSSIKIDKPRQSYSYGNSLLKPPSKAFVANESRIKNCLACNKSPHLLIHCKTFEYYSPEQKFQVIKENKLCLNCFSARHHVSSCTSKFRCRICKFKHHTLLHRRNELSENSNRSPVKVTDNTPHTSTSEDAAHSLCTTAHVKLTRCKSNVVLLSTTLVAALDQWNREHRLRFLIDTGSVCNLITANCCKRLGLTISKYLSTVSGIGGTSSPIKGQTQIVIRSIVDPNCKFSISALVVEKITNCIPDVSIDTKNLGYLNALPLADPTFHIPGALDGILSASIFADVLGSGQVVGPPNMPSAIQTAFGYVVVGKAPTLVNNELYTHCSFLTLDSMVHKLLELEDFSSPIASSDDEICEEIFKRNCSRDTEGRYTVALPFKEDPSKLGDSYQLALKRFQSLEKRFENLPELKKMYSECIQDYLKQGHMIPASTENAVQPSYIIPHHCIFKPNSTSTPCRVVFDSSAKTISGYNKSVSLNDLLYTGAKLQNHIFTILLNFRLFPIAITADLKNMFRQIKIIDEHHRFQKLLWRFDSNEPIATYELTRVSFGVRSSPYLSLRVIKQLIEDERDSYPEAAIYADRYMFVDDLVCSVPTLEEAQILQVQLVKFFAAGGFPLVKWSSNSHELLAQVPDQIKMSESVEFDESLPILGLQWNPHSDEFVFKFNHQVMSCTKRNMLSCIARIFDPLGYLNPVVLCLKLLIKELWKLNSDWDDLAPSEIENQWTKVHSELELLNNLKIPRFVLSEHFLSVSLIGFCDAAQSALGCLIFVRVETTSTVCVKLLCAQSKVAPMQPVTLPRLELNAAVLLAKFIAHVRNTYKSRIKIDNIYAFSDSMISLCWIHSDSSRWKTYISNRINKIHEELPASHWYFIPGKLNVADCVSRGLSPSALLNYTEWLSGPSWLYENISQWPIKPVNGNEVTEPEGERLVFVVNHITKPPLYHLIEYFSVWTKLLNSTVYVLRFLKMLPQSSCISAADLNKAELYLLQSVQQYHFSNEFRALRKNIPVTNKILPLSPFLQDGLIRVGGRLSNSNLKFDTIHPVLLPKSDPLVSCLIDYTHRLNCHAGPNLTVALLRQKYWILAARDVVRKRIWACNYCFKTKPKPIIPYMADLPSSRVTQYKAFLHTGIDYTGAYSITMSKHRGVKSQKAYVCLFVCFSTKAIHLELASDLSTEAFICAFKRFISRRGTCSVIYSDNATNFVGGKAQFDEIFKFVNSQEFKSKFQLELNNYRINWKFNPPTASHFGGLWEANIKSVKTHLTKVIGAQILTFEEFTTVLSQIEALLNSRPLSCLSTDPSEPQALTPAHFLYGSLLNYLPAKHVPEECISKVNRYKLLDLLVQSYWKRWHLEYLTSLQVRQKWNTPSNPIKIGTICIIIQKNLPPLQWPLAIVQEVYPGKDGVPRVALVKTKFSEYTRPVAKLCPLPTQ